MPGNAFLKFITADGKQLTGESLQTGHTGADGWVEIGDWSWEITSETSFDKGTGASVGKPMAGELSFKHYYDKSSPVIFKNILLGTHFKTARIDMLKQTGNEDGPEIYFTLQAGHVFITEVANSGGEDGQVNQDVKMVFKEIAIGYKKQENDGKLEGKAIEFKWNIAGQSEAPANAKVEFK